MSGAPRDWLSDAEATARRLAGDAGLIVPEVECANQCGRWIRLGSQASCTHPEAVCDDCFPTGCDACEWEMHETLKHREKTTNLVLSAALELRAGADDLSDTDLRELGWVARKDVLRNVELTVEALFRVRDVLRSVERPTS